MSFCRYIVLEVLARRSEGGQIVKELNSIRGGKCLDDAKGGSWFERRVKRRCST